MGHVISPPPLAVSIAECKAYLRIERDDEDALIAGFVRTAIALCEAFTGQSLVVRDGEQRLAREGGWQRITALPVAAVTGVFIVRLVAHLFTHRDAADAGPPPAAVAAMWRPWRRLRLA
jgi:uncharacterized phiE125 gp8 family phage protein